MSKTYTKEEKEEAKLEAIKWASGEESVLIYSDENTTEKVVDCLTPMANALITIQKFIHYGLLTDPRIADDHED